MEKAISSKNNYIKIILSVGKSTIKDEIEEKEEEIVKFKQ
jgi:hypothetical protein